MKLRTARSGRNAGNQFWGCSDFPDCRETLDLEKAGVDSEPAPPERTDRGLNEDNEEPLAVVDPLPVSWRTPAPDGFVAEYESVGCLPQAFGDGLRDVYGTRSDSGFSSLRRSIEQCVIYSRSDRDRASATAHARRSSAILAKLLKRGRTPLPTLGVEKAALVENGLMERVEELGVGELGWRPDGPGTIRPDALQRVLSRRRPFRLEPDIDLGRPVPPGAGSVFLNDEESSIERDFLGQWVPEQLGAEAGHWFTPQAPLDRTLESLGGTQGVDGAGGARRVDFLFCHPEGKTFVVELDGPEHRASASVDEARDAALGKVDIEVVRVPNREVEKGGGPALDLVRAHVLQATADNDGSAAAARPDDLSEQVAALILDCAAAARVQFAVARAVGFGWLGGGEDWLIRLVGGGRPAAAGVCDLLDMLLALDRLYGTEDVPCAPRSCRVVDGDAGEAEWRAGAVTWDLAEVSADSSEATSEEPGSEPPPEGQSGLRELTIEVDRLAGPFHAMTCPEADFVIRPVYLPVPLAAATRGRFPRREADPETTSETAAALTVFLRQIFRKAAFRDGQAEALLQVLKQQDTVVLLPTGGGKSLIYQLAGLLMPGVTLVVDPLIALMEDQTEGLRASGIDRVAHISSALGEDEQERVLHRFSAGELLFLLVAPERVLSPRFRTALDEVREAPINLAVIDEAHCVSEWGHDFRPAYLSVGRNLRLHARDGDDNAPPLLALTGTASRAVLRDMLVGLDVDRDRSDAVIRPETFDRPELRFEIVRAQVGKQQAALRRVLAHLPEDSGLPPEVFFGPERKRPERTRSGLVFVPHVNGPFGVRIVRRIVEQATGVDVGFFSGSRPKKFYGRFEEEKRRNATTFKRNEKPILVATKAFGMGIDKPNIRWTIHYGMPQSLESFYQEAGRAGRDGRTGPGAECKVVFTEYDRERTDHLLDASADLKEIRDRFREAEDWSTKDDILNSLFFHTQNFRGVQSALRDVEDVLDGLGDLMKAARVAIPLSPESKAYEKALYRLLRIGVVRDYENDYGSQRHLVDVRRFDLERCGKALLEYVEATQAARTAALERQVRQISGSPRDCVLALARLLIEFTYDVVEKSRRSAIRESMRLARTATSDEDIRRRLLDYLSEGLGTERIQQLLVRRTIVLPEWWRLFEKVESPLEAGELRGICVRFLESEGNHPGLLLVRAIVESMCSDADRSVTEQGVRNAIQVAFSEVFAMSESSLTEAIDWMFDWAERAWARGESAGEDRDDPLSLPLTAGMLGFVGDPDLQWAGEAALRRASASPWRSVRRLVSVWRLERTLALIEAVVERTVQRWATVPVPTGVDDQKATGDRRWTR